MPDTRWSCRCDAVQIDVADVPSGGVPAICYCTDCRAFARLHDATDDIDPAGGVSLYSTTPDRLKIVDGADKLACQRLTARGPLRWFTTCCDTPLGNGAPLRGVPFFSVMTAGLADYDARPVARLHRGSALGKVPKPHGSTYALLVGVARRVIAARLGGRWKDTPFFDDDGSPVADPGRPDAEAMRKAYGTAP
ncbi:hypothetical protein ILP92_06200 [Maribius pontilimi]|uniref:CENP-V/GFA domain-containing protein n=1 Tax=Palleronia pontilimi TaxID=1964209 RepID=A0A934MDF9_9RHOB|nr:DUF6151 family protein [Palleronia pontilimi]MBJ3762331.1 hypothetical protein [Palleronia pontilimi]